MPHIGSSKALADAAALLYPVVLNAASPLFSVRPEKAKEHDGNIDSIIRLKATQRHLYQKVPIDEVTVEHEDDSTMVASCQ